MRSCLWEWVHVRHVPPRPPFVSRNGDVFSFVPSWVWTDEFVFAGQHRPSAGRSEDLQRGSGPDLEEVWTVGHHRAALQLVSPTSSLWLLLCQIYPIFWTISHSFFIVCLVLQLMYVCHVRWDLFKYFFFSWYHFWLMWLLLLGDLSLVSTVCMGLSSVEPQPNGSPFLVPMALSEPPRQWF